MSSRARRILICLAAGAALLGALTPTVASGAGPPSDLSESACNLLGHSGASALVGAGGHPVTVTQILNACLAGSCWQTSVDADGQQQCDYSRGASLALGREKSDTRALKLVRRDLKKGYRKVKIKDADLAGIVSSPTGAGIVMAVGRTFALIALGASSDTNPSPTWGSDPAPDAKAVARKIASGLNRNGCPVRPGRCPSG